MATQQTQVVVVSIPRLIAVTFTALSVIGLMLVLWVFGATTTMTAGRWIYQVLTGSKTDSPTWWIVPVVFSFCEVVKWLFRTALHPTVTLVVTIVENIDWITTIIGLVLVLSAGVARVLTTPMEWWYYLIIIVVAVPLGRGITLWPERVSVDAGKNVVQEVEHYREAT